MIDPARICVALDVPELGEAVRIASELRAEGVRIVKVGLGLWCRYGAEAVARLRGAGLEVFLDLKLHDIPHQVGLAADAVRALGASWLTVHAAGGPEMIAAARNAAAPTRVVAVTVLTSLSASIDEVVARGVAAVAAGAHGLVCSPLEVGALRVALGEAPTLITPGIRAANAPADDQRRTASAAEALDRGASLLVVGRPILAASSPAAGLRAILGQ